MSATSPKHAKMEIFMFQFNTLLDKFLSSWWATSLLLKLQWHVQDQLGNVPRHHLHCLWIALV